MVLLEEEVDVGGVAEDVPEIKVRMMLIVWVLLRTINISENHVIPMGLHNNPYGITQFVEKF